MAISDTVWFTVKEKKWKVGYLGKFSWTGKGELWDSDNCAINFARTITGKCLIVVRSSQTKYSSYMEKQVLLRYMLGFEISGTPCEPKTETYTARDNIPKRREGPKERWVMQLDEKHWVWEWAQQGKDIMDSTVYRLYREIVAELEHPTIPGDNIIKAPVDVQSDDLIPVVYQPSVDALKNFVREVHCAKSTVNQDGSYTVEVSILFNNERLRQHGFLNSVYEAIRRLIYGRVMDLESFKILVAKDPTDDRFVFEGIYSGDAEMNEDSIHGDKAPPPAPKHPVKYCCLARNHPVVFINTSNHAMAEHDTNEKIWKWEYIPWSTNAPIKLGSLTRKQLEESLKKTVK
ncbi:MAG: hypothetical protein ACQCN6_09405 [Candidatus Bathyarchaeia archaeon]|jgi:hypothetical protein